MELSNGSLQQADGVCLLPELALCSMLPERLTLMELMALQNSPTSIDPQHLEGRMLAGAGLTMVSMVSMLLVCDGICTCQGPLQSLPGVIGP